MTGKFTWQTEIPPAAEWFDLDREIKTMKYPEKLIGRAHAAICPECLQEGGTSMETQEFAIEDNILTELIGWECMHCACSWWQTIKNEIGDTISNKVTIS